MTKKKEEAVEEINKKLVETPVEIIETPVVETPVVEKPVGEGEYYFMRIGETLEEVAKKFNTSVEKLNKLNNNPELIGTNQIRVK